MSDVQTKGLAPYLTPFGTQDALLSVKMELVKAQDRDDCSSSEMGRRKRPFWQP